MFCRQERVALLDAVRRYQSGGGKISACVVELADRRPGGSWISVEVHPEPWEIRTDNAEHPYTVYDSLGCPVVYLEEPDTLVPG